MQSLAYSTSHVPAPYIAKVLDTSFGVCCVQRRQLGALELAGRNPPLHQATLAFLLAERHGQRTPQVRHHL